MIIDSHVHSFPDKIADKVIAALEKKANSRAYINSTENELKKSMEKAGIDISVLLPVMTNPEQVVKLNDIAIKKVENYNETGLFSLGGMHPDYENFEDELKRIKENGLTGIKLHPAYQNCDLDDIKNLHIIDKANELDLAVVIHAGLDIGIPGHNFSSVKHIQNVMKEINPNKFVLAHLGNWKEWDEVEKSLCGMPLYMDTAFVLGNYEPPDGIFVPEEETKMLSFDQFLRIIKKHGAEKILFGTDSPWSDQKRTVNEVRTCGLSNSELKLIFSENAKKVFNIY